MRAKMLSPGLAADGGRPGRSHARYEIKARLEPPYTEMDMIRPPFVIALARHATKEAYLEVSYVRCI
jgi:hypothetical protein